MYIQSCTSNLVLPFVYFFFCSDNQTVEEAAAAVFGTMNKRSSKRTHGRTQSTTMEESESSMLLMLLDKFIKQSEVFDIIYEDDCRDVISTITDLSNINAVSATLCASAERTGHTLAVLSVLRRPLDLDVGAVVPSLAATPEGDGSSE